MGQVQWLKLSRGGNLLVAMVLRPRGAHRGSEKTRSVDRQWSWQKVCRIILCDPKADDRVYGYPRRYTAYIMYGVASLVKSLGRVRPVAVVPDNASLYRVRGYKSSILQNLLAKKTATFRLW